MDVVYALEEPPAAYSKSIFLAGPTPRSEDVDSWRADALKFLEKKEYTGVVFVPEPRGGKWAHDYFDQLEWEEKSLEQADLIVFWVPRDMRTMPALTTNVEFGRYENSGKIVFGAPKNASSVRYLQHYAEKCGARNLSSLEDTLAAAMGILGRGELRIGGERSVPLHIWKTVSFQNWLANLQAAGNRLDDCRVLWNFRVGKDKSVFLWAIQPKVWVTSEERHKDNEVVLARTDNVSVVLYYRTSDGQTKVLLVKEFRSPVNNREGFVYECPGGSASDATLSSLDVAAAEVKEETGLAIDASRLEMVGQLQAAATVGVHTTTCFKAELTIDEYRQAMLSAGVVFGTIEDSEITYVEVVDVDDLGQIPIDWATYGMILKATR
jgi:8-oxo-dGTP pyrophosphatase MutT (NUDIX family)